MSEAGRKSRLKLSRSRKVAIVAALLVGLSSPVVTTQAASAATCTAFGRDRPASYLSGSCTGSNSSGVFTVRWTCGKWETPKSMKFGGAGLGASFRFKACNRTVYSAWVTG